MSERYDYPITVGAFAPIVALLLGLSSGTVPWDTLLTSVGLYIVVPVILAQAWRRGLLGRGVAHIQEVVSKLGPLSIAALLLTLALRSQIRHCTAQLSSRALVRRR